jgi:hypothetical protein
MTLVSTQGELAWDKLLLPISSKVARVGSQEPNIQPHPVFLAPDVNLKRIERQTRKRLTVRLFKRNLQWGSPARQLQPSTTYRLGVLQERKDLVRGGGIFSLWRLHCLLLGVVKELGLVL